MSEHKDSSPRPIKKIVLLSHQTIMNAHRLVEKVILKRQKRDNEVAGGSRSTDSKDLQTIKQSLEQAIGDIDQLLLAIANEHGFADNVSDSLSSGPSMGGMSASYDGSDEQEDRDE